jgi:hypothetical protein
MKASEYIKMAGLIGKAASDYRKFDTLCKQASKCREGRRQISCYSCPAYANCTIQSQMKKVQP